MTDLPDLVDTAGWDWHCLDHPGAASDGFWVGTDRQGNRWLTKLRGSFYAYREIIFGRLAQALDWSCQSTVFMRLDSSSAAAIGQQAGEVHAAHWFMEEHVLPPCGPNCGLQPMVGCEIFSLEDLLKFDIRHLIDWPKSEFAAYIFGGNEPPGRLFTAAHEFVIIDSEQMFSTGPCPFDTAAWLTEPDGSPSKSGHALAIEVCKQISMLSMELVVQALSLPGGITVELRWPIAQKLQASIDFSREYLNHNTRA